MKLTVKQKKWLYWIILFFLLFLLSDYGQNWLSSLSGTSQQENDEQELVLIDHEPGSTQYAYTDIQVSDYIDLESIP